MDMADDEKKKLLDNAPANGKTIENLRVSAY